MHDSTKVPSNYGEDNHPLSRLEILSFRNRQYLQDQIDAYNILKDFDSLNERLTAHHIRTLRSETLTADLQWRSDHFGNDVEFWNLARSDLPSQLTEGTYGDYGILDVPQAPEVDEQFLSRHSAFAGAVLVRDTFRSFNRGDGS